MREGEGACAVILAKASDSHRIASDRVSNLSLHRESLVCVPAIISLCTSVSCNMNVTKEIDQETLRQATQKKHTLKSHFAGNLNTTNDRFAAPKMIKNFPCNFKNFPCLFPRKLFSMSFFSMCSKILNLTLVQTDAPSWTRASLL